jgi:hypothetical protein
LNHIVNDIPLIVAGVSEWPVSLDKPKHAFGRICGPGEYQKQIGGSGQRVWWAKLGPGFSVANNPRDLGGLRVQDAVALRVKPIRELDARKPRHVDVSGM